MYFSSRDMGWLMLVGMLILMLFIQMKPFGLFEPEQPYADTDFDVLRNAVDNYEELNELKDDLEDQLDDAEDRIKELEDTDWYTKYELVKGELEKERDSHPSILVSAYVGGFLGFIVVFFFTWLYRNKEYADLKRKNKELEKKLKKKGDKK
jgi:hypothetical protein